MAAACISTGGAAGGGGAATTAVGGAGAAGGAGFGGIATAGGAAIAAGAATGGLGGMTMGAGGRADATDAGVTNFGAGGSTAGFTGADGLGGGGATGASGLAATGGAGGLGTARGGACAAASFCKIARSTSPGREMCERSIFVLISLSGRAAREDFVADVSSACARKYLRTRTASCSSRELECVFFSVTPTSGSESRIALLLTSSSRARSLIRILLIHPLASCNRFSLKLSCQPHGSPGDFELTYWLSAHCVPLLPAKARNSLLRASQLSSLSAAFSASSSGFTAISAVSSSEAPSTG